MKYSSQVFTLFLGVIIFLISSQVVVANENATRQGRAVGEAQQIRQEKTEKRREETEQKVQERRQETLEDRQLKTAERRGALAQVHAEQLQRRFGFYYERLSGLIQKLEARLTALAQEGIDVVAAQNKLEAAKASLEEAKTLTDQAIAAFLEIDLESDTARVQVQTAKDLAKQAQERFRETVALAKEALRLAKSAHDATKE